MSPSHREVIEGLVTERDRLIEERDRLRLVVEQARAALIAIRDPFWLPPNVVEEIDRHLVAIETALGEQP